VQIRPATVDDSEAILEIYNHQVLTSTATFDLVPRTLAEQQTWLTDRSGAHAVVVAVDDAGEVVGFGALSPYRERAGYATTVEDSVYVAENHHGEGVGSSLLEHLVDTARKHGFHALMAKIVGGHEQSMGLHHRCGFEVVGTEREVGRKFGRWLDVVLMERLL
jgi:phosphinothricin acetyltransferase